ncbi:amidohydrolase family protein [Bradyrhizobium sp. LHD-71]|uniref:amidohydrolase family protein n=1 Tax=Bradyrhizobium sp. LHD-71 TaxID=3072141 RepID=UPI00280FA302|nr:amidohydrolase family protein [Bradyrhizobium sp. LHD-71]MDQ8727904.1 amidohydrolase family protein [Bradyrhizobium sp. LHD-71]
MTKPGFDVRPSWLARHVEDILDPDLTIIDPHHHLWDRDGEKYLLPELLTDANDGHAVVATVFVQCRHAYRTSGPAALQPVGEVEAVVDTADTAVADGRGLHACAGIVAGADLTLGADVSAVLDAMREVAGHRLAGIRNSVAWHPHAEVRSSSILPPPHLMTNPRFRAGVRCLSRQNLSLDVWAYQTQHDELLELAIANPDVTIVIDHLGGPVASGPYRGKREEMFASWKDGLKALARLPNTRLKLGGLGMRVGGFDFHESIEPPTSQQLADAWRPYVETGIDLFGPARCMFESNFPVDKGMYSYRAFWNACKRLVAGATESEKAALFRATAIDVYKLDQERPSR